MIMLKNGLQVLSPRIQVVIKKEDINFKSRLVHSGNEGIVIKQIKRLVKVVKDIESQIKKNPSKKI